MFGEIAYMIVWGFFSAMGWMAAQYTVDQVTAKQPEVEINSAVTETQRPK